MRKELERERDEKIASVIDKLGNETHSIRKTLQI